MIPYQTKSKLLPGTSYGDMLRSAFTIYDEIKRKTKRRPYIRSAYFKKEKVFLEYFREHLFQKSPKERMKRLKYFKAAIELIQSSKNEPAVKNNPNKREETLYKFAGLTAEKEIFFVQIKENRKGNKYFMSCFPPE
jgi:hypothetical protein